MTMKSDKPIVYTCFCTDVIHDGHLNLINEAKSCRCPLRFRNG